jgi:hypothetical protein
LRRGRLRWRRGCRRRRAACRFLRGAFGQLCAQLIHARILCLRRQTARRGIPRAAIAVKNQLILIGHTQATRIIRPYLNGARIRFDQRRIAR